jgi:hypothetical protein
MCRLALPGSASVFPCFLGLRRLSNHITATLTDTADSAWLATVSHTIFDYVNIPD